MKTFWEFSHARLIKSLGDMGWWWANVGVQSPAPSVPMLLYKSAESAFQNHITTTKLMAVCVCHQNNTGVKAMFSFSPCTICIQHPTAGLCHILPSPPHIDKEFLPWSLEKEKPHWSSSRRGACPPHYSSANSPFTSAEAANLNIYAAVNHGARVSRTEHLKERGKKNSNILKEIRI